MFLNRVRDLFHELVSRTTKFGVWLRQNIWRAEIHPTSMRIESMADRSDFLLRMYEQMFKDIAQAYTVVWQSVASVFAAFAAIALAEKGLVPIDMSLAIVVLVITWFGLNVLECSYWYNRNLCIIANIERQFLSKDDLKNIQYYFGSHRPNKMISHLRNQMFLATCLCGTVLAYHFYDRVMPGLREPVSQFDFMRALPYVVAVVCGFVLLGTQRQRNIDYKEFLDNSPGIPVDTTGVRYGSGHGHK